VQVLDENGLPDGYERFAAQQANGLELFFIFRGRQPFRLIYSFNPSRENVLNNQLQPAKAQTFRFAVGTTF
jgi:hypothetical protein